MAIEDAQETQEAFDKAYDAETTTEDLSTQVEDQPTETSADEAGETPTGENSTEEPATGEGAATEEPDPFDAAVGSKKGSEEYNTVLSEMAQRMKKDLNDPSQRKDLETVVDKELHIRSQAAEIAALKEKIEGDEVDPLAELERELSGETDKPEQGKEEERPEAERPPHISDSWKTKKAPIADELKAWQEGDHDKVADIREEMVNRQLLSTFVQQDQQTGDIVPSNFMQNLVSTIVQQQFGGKIPELQNVVADRERTRAQEEAITYLEKYDKFSDIRGITQPDGGQPVKVNGKNYDSTPLNRALADYPALLELAQANGTDKVAYAKVLATAHGILKLKNGSPRKNEALLNAGIKTGERRTQERNRQTVNKGSGTTAATGTQNKSYVDILKEGRGVSLGDL
ncbi:MAG: hypothetical protein GWP08_21465 [Nitrospiraceae bacterium]|nr:hypothetical protein [Nitrospiraceae bacterium]